jgi:hypothetical protein
MRTLHAEDSVGPAKRGVRARDLAVRVGDEVLPRPERAVVVGARAAIRGGFGAREEQLHRPGEDTRALRSVRIAAVHRAGQIHLPEMPARFGTERRRASRHGGSHEAVSARGKRQEHEDGEVWFGSGDAHERMRVVR